MKKPLLGIVAVFCLHVVFVAYNAIETFLDEASNAISVGDPLAGMADTSGISDNEFLIAEAAEEPTELVVVSGRHPNASPIKRSARILPRPKVFRRSEVASSRRPSVAKPNAKYVGTAPARQPFIPEFDDGPAELPEKKSLVSKALPILKKPYNWIKSIASKIN